MSRAELSLPNHRLGPFVATINRDGSQVNRVAGGRRDVVQPPPPDADPPGPDEPVVVHLHNPKTGGTSINALLAESLRPCRILGGAGAPVPAGARSVFGHVAFGVHERCSRPVTYITVLREPTARAISLYHQVVRQLARTSRLPLPARVSRDAVRAAATSLERWIAEQPLHEQDNGMVRRLSGMGRADRPVTRHDLDAAVSHLMTMGFGVTERMDEFLQLVGPRIELSGPIEQRNVGRYDRPPRKLRRRIARANPLDEELYALAVDRFADQPTPAIYHRPEPRLATPHLGNPRPDPVRDRGCCGPPLA